MNFLAAESLSSTNGMPVRREARDPDAWFILWRPPIWWIWDTGIWRQVKQTDYTADDLFADDWTTVPAPLAACPVTPTEPIGGGPPPPTFPGYPTFPTSPDTPPPGFPPPGGGGGPLPPPNLGTSVSVTFEGLETIDFPTVAGPGVAHWNLHGSDFDRSVVCSSAGGAIFTGTFEAGTFVLGDGTEDHRGEWMVLAQRLNNSPDPPTWHVSLSGIGDFAAVWEDRFPLERGQPMSNINPSIDIFGGTATVN